MTTRDRDLVVDAVCHSWDDQPVLHQVDFLARPGHPLVVSGPSGSGKTTLLNLIAGLVKPDSGTITHGDVDVSALTGTKADRWRRDTVALVFQRTRLVSTLSVEENVSLGTRLAGLDRPTEARAVTESLEAVGLTPLRRRRPAELSGGQAQRVGIARALASGAPLLLADEPTSSLDSTLSAEMTDLLCERSQQNDSTLIIATHDPVVVQRVTAVIELIDGRRSEPESHG